MNGRHQRLKPSPKRLGFFVLIAKGQRYYEVGGFDMGESGQFEAQGRAHRRLKEARSTIATIEAELLRHGKTFHDLADSVNYLVRDPLLKSDSRSPLAGHIKEESTAIASSETITRLVDELVRETELAKELEARIAKF